jgi:hypothetical protein
MRTLIDALGRLLRPDQHIVLRLLDDQPMTVADLIAVPRLESACESVLGCCDAWTDVTA